MKKFLRAFCWLSLGVSIFLVGLGVWLHFNLDPLLRIPFVFATFGGGMMLALSIIGYLIRG